VVVAWRLALSMRMTSGGGGTCVERWSAVGASIDVCVSNSLWLAGWLTDRPTDDRCVQMRYSRSGASFS
jgi:hypothetical protein